MSRARHRAKGGGVKEHAKPEWEAGGSSNAAKEAEEKSEGEHLKKGGRAHGEGHKSKHGGHRRARGGATPRATGGAAKRARGGGIGHDTADSGHHHALKHANMHHRHGLSSTPGRKRGGGVGADRMPLTTAAKVKSVVKGEQPEEGVRSD
jgi:hypothetical protein